MNVFKKIKNIFQKKVILCSKGLKGALRTHQNFFPQNIFIFFPPFIKNVFATNSELFSQKYARSKIERHFLLQSLQFAAFQQSFPNVGENTLFLRGH